MKVQKGDEVDRRKLSSNSELKRQLLGRDFEKKQKMDRKDQQDVLTSRTAVNEKAAFQEPLRKVEVDSDEDAGRSSLGKRKWKRSLQAGKHAAVTEEVKEKDKGFTLSDDIGRAKDPMALTQQEKKTFTDINSVERTSKKRKKRNRK